MAEVHKNDHIKMFLATLFTVAKKATQISINRGLIKYNAKNSYKEILCSPLKRQYRFRFIDVERSLYYVG